jgi:hypothetical protein
MKMLYDNCSLRITLLHSILSSECPDEIITFVPEHESVPTGDAGLPFVPNDNVFSMLLRYGQWPCRVREIKRKDIPHPPDTITELREKRSLSMRSMAPLVHLIIFLKRSIWHARKKLPDLGAGYSSLLASPGRERSSLIILGNSHWAALAPRLHARGYLPLRYRERDIRVAMQSIPDRSVERPEIAECAQPFCAAGGINFTDIYITHFVPYLLHYLATAPQYVQEFEEYLRKHPAKAVLSGEKGSFRDHIQLHVASHHNIPVLTWQHGDGPFYPPMQLYVEIMNSDIHLCYGEGHRKVLSGAPHNTFPCEIVPVGSLLLEEICRKEKTQSSGRRKVLYVTTNYYHNNLYVNNFPTIDTNLWETQKMILEVLSESGRQVTFKLFPERLNETFLFEFLEHKRFSSITPVKSEFSFRELLSDHDIVICDYPSTPVIESIAAHKTVFVLLNYPFFNEEALPLLKKRVYWSSNRTEFVSMIRRYLNGEPLDQHPDLENTEYLETYGIHKPDGNVGERAISLIREAITGAAYR